MTWPVLSKKDAAAALGITPKWLSKLEADGFVTRSARGQYEALALFQGYVRYLKDEARRTSKSAAASRVTDRREELLALQIEERSRSLIAEARAEAMALTDELIGSLKADMIAVPARVTLDLELRQKIEDGIDDVFGAAAKRAQRQAESLEARGIAAKAGGPNHRTRLGAPEP